jgi:hypothetical protein
MLLRAGLGSLSLLCGERCRCVELLLHARFSFQRLLGLLSLRASAGSGRHRGFTETAPGKRQTRQEHEKHSFHLATPICSDTGTFTIRLAAGKCATLIIPRQFRRPSIYTYTHRDRRTTHLALVRYRYQNIRANILYARLDPKGRGRDQTSAELPLIYATGARRGRRSEPPEINFPADADDSTKLQRIRESKIEPRAFLGSLPVYRSTADASKR